MGDRRALVFLVFAAICFALTPAAEPEFRWVCFTFGTIYVVLALASALAARSRSRL
ncbi:MAG TPA: hypothetical protein VFB78_16280 [Acidimicrobiales bacterium]|jgi:hypothetical protein|nr:hypothetical protein [Acidimicrobiales bacterium]